jgi:hypothetical protein
MGAKMWLCFIAGGRAQAFDLLARGDGMAEFRGRDLHLVKKALAIAAIERQPGQFQPFSDQTDVKALLEALIENDVELEHCARSARMAVTG